MREADLGILEVAGELWDTAGVVCFAVAAVVAVGTFARGSHFPGIYQGKTWLARGNLNHASKAWVIVDYQRSESRYTSAMETFIKVFMGSGEAGRKLKAALRAAADEKYFGSMSRLVVYDFCEKYGFNPRTGEPVHGSSVGAPVGQHGGNESNMKGPSSTKTHDKMK